MDLGETLKMRLPNFVSFNLTYRDKIENYDSSSQDFIVQEECGMQPHFYLKMYIT